MILHEIRRPNSLKTVLSGVTNCHNLPFGGRAMRGSRVRLLREENAWSRHQRLFEESIEKTGKVWSTNYKCERFESCIYAWGRYQHSTRPSQRTIAFNQVCKDDFKFFLFSPFLCLSFQAFFCIFFIFLWSTRVFPLLLRIPQL